MATERLRQQVEQLLDEAQEAVTRLDWETVRTRVTAVLTLDPDNADAQALLAAVERAQANTASPAQNIPASPAAAPSASPSPVQPTSFANSRYVVKRFLGEGGKKKVYLAQDTLLDRVAALRLNRRSVGLKLSSYYLGMAAQRLKHETMSMPIFAR